MSSPASDSSPDPSDLDGARAAAAGLRRAISGQTLLSSLLLFVFLLIELTVQVLTQHDRILLPHRVAEWKRVNGAISDNGFYDDDAIERLLVDVVPHADYSKGGAYYIGSSRTAKTVLEWELSPAEQARIGNYAIGATTHTEQFQWLRYLVEQRGLLSAGGNRNLVILDLFFNEANHRATLDQADEGGLWQYALNRDGLYTLDPVSGIHDANVSAIRREFRVALSHDAAFWWWLRTQFAGGAKYPSVYPHQVAPPGGYQQMWLNTLGPDWEKGLDIEIDQLKQMIDYLQARHVKVIGVYMPQASWCRDFALSVRYRTEALQLLKSKSVQVIDLVDSSPDEDFVDSAHLNYLGTHKIQPLLLAPARQHLRELSAGAQ